MVFWPSCSGSQIPPKSRSHLKIWGTSVKWQKIHTQDQKISGAPTQNVATQAQMPSWTHVYSVTGDITDVSAFLTQSTPSHLISLLPMLILSSHQYLGLPSGLFPSGFPHYFHACTSPLPPKCYMPHPSISLWFDHLNNIWQGAQIMKLFVT